MIFSAWFGYFEYVSYQTHDIRLSVINALIRSLSTSTGLPNCGASSSKKSPARTSQTTFDTFYQTQHLLHLLHKSFFFLHFNRVFTFLEIIKHENVAFCFIFNIKMAIFTDLNFFKKMYTDMTAVTIESNKIVSNEVKDNWVLLQPSYGEGLNELFDQPSILIFILLR